MIFNQGDQVVHQNFGVGVVVSIEGMKFSGSKPRLFYRVEFMKTTVWVPVGDQPESGLRPITPKSDLARYRSVLKSSPVGLDSDFRKRQIELEERIDRGTFQGLCIVLRDLNALDTLKPLNYSDKAFYKQTREALVLEWSATSGLSHADAANDIDGCLYKGKLNSANV